jgi:hypothetical protein
MNAIRKSPRKKMSLPATASLATAAGDANKDNSVHPPPRKKKSPPATAASATAAGDASKDNSGNPPYKPRYKRVLNRSWMMMTTTPESREAVLQSLRS